MSRMTIGSPYPRVTLERSSYEISPVYGPVVDRGWRFVDAAGHAHSGENLRATLTEVTEECYDPDDGETWDAHVRWECSLCGETIVPGTRAPDPWGQVVAGPLMVTILDVRDDGWAWEESYRMPAAVVFAQSDSAEDVAAAAREHGQLCGERCLGSP